MTRWIRAAWENSHVFTCANDVNVKDRHSVAGTPISYDPRRCLGSNAGQSTKRVAELNVCQAGLIDRIQANERTGQIFCPLSGEAIANRPSLYDERFKQQRLQSLLG